MTTKTGTILGVIIAVLFSFSSARADIVQDYRFGIMAHNIKIIDGKNADKEDGANISGDVVFHTPERLKWALSPNPYLTASVNTAGETSWFGGGLYWDFPLTERLSFEAGMGYVVHNGEVNNPFPTGSPQFTAFFNDNVLLGSRDLFRPTLGLNYHVNERFGIQLFYEHLSHGQILDSGRNQGMDELGLRLIFKR